MPNFRVLDDVLGLRVPRRRKRDIARDGSVTIRELWRARCVLRFDLVMTVLRACLHGSEMDKGHVRRGLVAVVTYGNTMPWRNDLEAVTQEAVLGVDENLSLLDGLRHW